MANPAFTPKLSPEQKREIFKKTLAGESTKDLAAEYNVSEKTIRTIKYDPKRLAKAEAAIDAHQRFARLRIHSGAMKGIEKEHEILDREVPEGVKGTSLLYLQHQVASSMMDRDGLKAVEKSESAVSISFDSGIEIGMPPSAEDGAEGGTDV